MANKIIAIKKTAKAQTFLSTIFYFNLCLLLHIRSQKHG